MFGDAHERPRPPRQPGTTLVDSIRDEIIDDIRHDCFTLKHLDDLAAWIRDVYAPTEERRAENEAALTLVRRAWLERREEILRETESRRPRKTPPTP